MWPPCPPTLPRHRAGRQEIKTGRAIRARNLHHLAAVILHAFQRVPTAAARAAPVPGHPAHAALIAAEARAARAAALGRLCGGSAAAAASSSAGRSPSTASRASRVEGGLQRARRWQRGRVQLERLVVFAGGRGDARREDAPRARWLERARAPRRPAPVRPSKSRAASAASPSSQQ